MVLVSGIVKPSPALKNTLNSYNQNEGLKSETKVIEYFQKRKWCLLFHRAKTKIAEIDLIFQKSNKIKLVEVKKLNNQWRSFERVSEKQIQKLILNQIYLSQKFSNYYIESNICWVNSNGNVTTVELN